MITKHDAKLTHRWKTTIFGTSLLIQLNTERNTITQTESWTTVWKKQEWVRSVLHLLNIKIEVGPTWYTICNPRHNWSTMESNYRRAYFIVRDLINTWQLAVICSWSIRWDMCPRWRTLLHQMSLGMRLKQYTNIRWYACVWLVRTETVTEWTQWTLFRVWSFTEEIWRHGCCISGTLLYVHLRVCGNLWQPWTNPINFHLSVKVTSHWTMLWSTWLFKCVLRGFVHLDAAWFQFHFTF